MSLPERTTLATWIFAIHHALEDEGIDSRAILSALEINLDELTQSTRVPKVLVTALWSKALEASKNDAFSLKALHFVNDPALNALITAVQASTDVRQAFAVMLRYYKLISPGTNISLEIDVDLRLVVTDATPEPFLTPEDVDLVFGMIRRFGCNLARQEIRPTRLFLTRPRPERAQDYAEFFDCEVIFGAERNVLAFSRDIMDADIPGKNPALSSHVELFLASRTERQDDLEIKDRLRSALIALLPGDTPKLEQMANRLILSQDHAAQIPLRARIHAELDRAERTDLSRDDMARRLNLSPRSLSRHLQEEGCCWRELLSDYRIARARQLLGESPLSVEQIAEHVGYASASALSNAFQRSFGLSPTRFRAQIEAAPTASSKQ